MTCFLYDDFKRHNWTIDLNIHSFKLIPKVYTFFFVVFFFLCVNKNYI